MNGSRTMKWYESLFSGPGISGFLLSASLPALPAPDPVREWNATAHHAIRFSNTPPPVATRNLAILHVAMFDAVNALDGADRRYAGYLDHGAPPVGASAKAAVAAAANQVLRQLWPQFTVTVDEAYLAQIRTIPGAPARTAGIAWGRQVANDVLRHRALDGSNFGVDYDGGTGPGRWVPTPPLFLSALLPQWAGMVPFVLERPDQSYARFSQAAAEAGMSRIYGGIHFMSANVEGQACGRAVARHVMSQALVPISAARLTIESVSGGCRLTWPRGYVLETAAGVAGTWLEVPMDSPCVVEAEDGSRFFRLRLR
jgi:hypothetical protein